jgi:predicted nucleotidyltransferase
MTQTQLNIEIDSITRQLIEKYKAEKIILFGSAAEDRFTPDSDIDFFIIKRNEKGFHERLVDVYRLIKKNVAADFIVYTPQELEERIALGDPFIKSILTEGKVLYG